MYVISSSNGVLFATFLFSCSFAIQKSYSTKDISNNETVDRHRSFYEIIFGKHITTTATTKEENRDDGQSSSHWSASTAAYFTEAARKAEELMSPARPKVSQRSRLSTASETFPQLSKIKIANNKKSQEHTTLPSSTFGEAGRSTQAGQEILNTVYVGGKSTTLSNRGVNTSTQASIHQSKSQTKSSGYGLPRGNRATVEARQIRDRLIQQTTKENVEPITISEKGKNPAPSPLQSTSSSLNTGNREHTQVIPEYNTHTTEAHSQSATCSACGGHIQTNQPEGISESEIIQIQLNMFQDLFMEKMRISKSDLLRQNKSATYPKMPKVVLEKMMKDNRRLEEQDDFYARDKEVIVTGHDMGRDCVRMRRTGCYSFQFTGMVRAEVASAELWLYKTRDRHDYNGQTFIVYELERFGRRLRRRNLISRMDSSRKQGWVTLNVSRAVQRWVSKGHREQKLAIRCKTCFLNNHRAIFGAKHNYKPLLIIKFVDEQSTRRRRRSGSTCNPSYECCKKPLQVNFRAINMTNVIMPVILNVNFCFGFCNMFNATYNHTRLLHGTRLHNATLTPQMRQQLEPCCVPIALRDTSVLWREESGLSRERVVSQVIVDRCGCA